MTKIDQKQYKKIPSQIKGKKQQQQQQQQQQQLISLRLFEENRSLNQVSAFECRSYLPSNQILQCIEKNKHFSPFICKYQFHSRYL